MKHKSSYHPIFWIGLIGGIAFVILYTTRTISVLYLESLFLLITFSILGFTFKYDKKILKKAVIYFNIGLYWEISTEANWIYENNLLPFSIL